MYDQIAANKRKSWLLIVLFCLVIGALGYLWGVTSGDRFGALTIAGIIAIVSALVSYFASDAIALHTAGAEQILERAENPYVWNLVENLCIAQGLPMPKVYLIPDQAMNAFACGRDPKHASIALTEGIVTKLENEELEGVVAHELSHVKNYDIRVATMVIVLVGLVSIMSDIFLRSSFYRQRRGGSRSDSAGGVLVLIGVVLALLSPLIAQLIKLAVSRQREYLADAAGALATRYPEGLARALEKIGAAGQPMSHVSEATAHLYLASPFGNTPSFLGKMFSTHPPIADRVKALRAMA